MDIIDELKKIEDIARGPGFGWEDPGGSIPFEDPRNARAYRGDDLFFPGDREEAFDGSAVVTPSGTTYGIRIVNTALVAAPVQLFGYVGRAFYAGMPGTLTITAQTGYGSYPFMMDYSMFNPFEVVSVRITSPSAQIDQMSYAWNKASPWGKTDSNVVSLATYRTEKDFQSGILTLPIRHVVDSASWIEFNLLASTTLDMILFIGVRKDLAKAVEQNPSNPIISGKAGRIQVPRASTGGGGA